MITVGSLFSGVGGLDIGAERAELRVVWQCAEIAARRVLAHLEGRIRGPSQSSMFGAPK